MAFFLKADATLLSLLRASTLLSSFVAAALAAIVLGLGLADPGGGIGPTAGGSLFAAGSAASVISIVSLGRERPDIGDPGRLAASLYGVTMNRILLGSAPAPLGAAVSVGVGEPAIAIIGAGLTIGLMTVLSPTRERLHYWQKDIRERGSDLDVVEVLSTTLRGH